MAILRISDGTTTLDLLNGTNYRADTSGLDISPPRSRVAWGSRSSFRQGADLISSQYENRLIKVAFHILGSSLTDFQTALRAIHRLLNDAKQREILGHGAVVYLEFQLGDAAGASTFFDILSGDLVLPSTFLSTNLYKNFNSIRAELQLTCKPLGRFTNQTVAQAVLENEQDGANLNYMDIVTAEAYGDIPAKMYIKIDLTNAAGNKKVWCAKRSGSRYDDDLWIQGEDETSSTDLSDANIVMTFSDEADAAMSGGSFRRTNGNSPGWGAVDLAVARHNYDISTLPKGTFRVLIYSRVDDHGLLPYTGMGWAVGWEYGSVVFTPTLSTDDYFFQSATGTWEIVDLGLITIPPVQDSDIAAVNTLQLRIFQAVFDVVENDAFNVDWDLDFIFLLPVDEGVVIIDDVPAANKLALDSITEPAGAYILDATDKVDDVPDFIGRPFTLGRETTRIYLLRDDGKTVTFTVDITYQPQFLVV